MAKEEMNQDQIDKHDLVLQSQELANIMLQATPEGTNVVAMVNAGLAYVGYTLAHMNNKNINSGSTPFDIAAMAHNVTNDIVKAYEMTTVSIHTEAVTDSPEINTH